jgi:hypothetical protein
MLTTVWLKTATSAKTASFATSWKKSLPTSSRGTWPQMARSGARLLGVVQTVEKVDGARSHCPHADAEATGELCLGAGGEGRGLLVAANIFLAAA